MFWQKNQQTNQIQRNMLSLWQRFIFEMTFALKPDPWQYTSLYQQTKYQQTLDLLPSILISRALELGCAEGYLTVPLAARVSRLIATDISQIALSRAAKSCALQRVENVNFLRLDLTRDPLPDGCELIVCSEVLYYISGRTALQAVARKLADALTPGGYLLTAHHVRVDKEPDRTKLDWLLPFGANLISETLANTYPLQLVKEMRAPRYRIQLFRHHCPAAISELPSLQEVVEFPQSTPPLRQHNGLYDFSLAFLYNQLHKWYK